jgi:PAS domain S-box-containing protein
MSNRIADRMRKMALGAGMLALALGIAVLLGYAMGIPALATVVPGHTIARPNAAVGLLLGGLAVLLLRRGGVGGWRRRAGRLSVLLMLVLGGATLSEYLFGWRLGIDQLLFQEAVRSVPSPAPGRMSALTALSLVLLGGGLLGLDWEPRRGWRPAQWCSLATLTIGLLVLLGYTFGETQLTSFGASVAMSIPAALGVAALAAGLLLARPEQGWMRLVSSQQAPGTMLRSWLPLAVGTVWLVSWLSIAGSRAGFYSQSVDQVFTAVPLILVLCVVFFVSARELNRTAEQREAQQLEVQQLNQELEARVEQRTAQLVETNRVAYEQAAELRQQEERYRSLVTATSQIVWTTNPQGEVEDMPLWRELTGQTREQVRGAGWLQALHPDDRERTAQVWATAVKNRSTYETEYRVRHRDGQYRDFAARGVPVLQPDGSIREWVGTCADITERKRAEEQLRQTSLYTRTLLEASLDPLVTIRKDGRIMDVNRATEQVTGVSRERLIGSDFSNYFTEPERARQGYEQVFSRGFVQDYPLVIRRRSGQVVEVLYNATVFKNGAGEVEGVFAAARDVTARKRAEREAQRLNRALRALSECNAAVVRASDEKSLLKQVCDIAVEVGGYRMAWVGYAEQDENKTVRPLAQAGGEEGYLGTVDITWADTERGRGPTGTAIRTGEVAICQDTLTDPDFLPWREEAQRWGFRSSIVLPLKSEAGVFGSISIYAVEARAFDAAEQQLLEQLAGNLGFGILALRARTEVRALNAELEERVRQRTAELEESNRELESFTYSVSHDLRAPLRHADGFSKILLEEYGPRLDEAGRRYLERVRQGTQYMGRLVDDLLNLSRVGRQEPAVQITGLGTLVEEVRQELAAEQEGRDVEWRIGELPFVECDPGLMKQVLANLLSNALKFTRPRAQAVIEVGQQAGEHAPVIFVRDNGVGFHMKYADRLFGIFQRLHRQEDFEGTGVGLATVQRILHKHGGQVWADAELDRGATFYFTLDAAEPSAKRPAEKLEAAA